MGEGEGRGASGEGPLDTKNTGRWYGSWAGKPEGDEAESEIAELIESRRAPLIPATEGGP